MKNLPERIMGYAEAESEATPPQPPSGLPRVSGGYALLVRIGTMAANEGPNGASMDAASTASRGWNTNVAEASHGTASHGLAVVRPEVPPYLPERFRSFYARHEWAGRVTAIHKHELDARLRNLTTGGREVATIDLDEISQEDRARMRVGSVFHWVIGYERSVSGTRSDVSRIVFLNPPRLTLRDLERGRQWADRLRAKWNLD